MVKRIMKITGITLASILCVVVLALAGLIAYLSITEYKPEQVQAADRLVQSEEGTAVGTTVTVYTWNMGYAGLGKESDFFMDGGTMVDPPSQETVETNMAAIREFLRQNDADAWLIQEVDVNSARTEGMDQFAALTEAVPGDGVFAYNYKCPFVPIPLPPMGRMESGLATVTPHSIRDNAERISLPCPFSWPVRAANIKRCLLVTRLAVEGSDRELVLINLHLEAYESGEGRIAQTKQLLGLMQAEYEKGNYVIAGGDFNQTFPGALDAYPIRDPEKWTPGVLTDESLPEGWQYAFDDTNPTCRLLDQPYCDDCQLYVIDGFILSPNVELTQVKTINLDFTHSDHNPVRLQVRLLP